MKLFIKNEKGFTLIEILIVLAIISILVLLILPNAMGILDAANDQGCEALEASRDVIEISNLLTGGNAEVDPEALARVCN